MKREWAATLLVWSFLVLSLAFLLYLYPLPTTNVERAMSSIGSSPDAVTARNYLERSYWLSWIINITLLITGVGSSVTWLRAKESIWKHWLAIALASISIAVWAMLMLAQADGVADWFKTKQALIAQLYSAGAWSFLAAEAHRLATLLVALAVTAFMIVYVATRPGWSSPRG